MRGIKRARCGLAAQLVNRSVSPRHPHMVALSSRNEGPDAAAGQPSRPLNLPPPPHAVLIRVKPATEVAAAGLICAEKRPLRARMLQWSRPTSANASEHTALNRASNFRAYAEPSCIPGHGRVQPLTTWLRSASSGQVQRPPRHTRYGLAMHPPRPLLFIEIRPSTWGTDKSHLAARPSLASSDLAAPAKTRALGGATRA